MIVAPIPVVLVMRTGLLIRFDHVETMFRSGGPIHLLTEDKSASSDPRFASVQVLAEQLATAELARLAHAAAVVAGAGHVVTFQETDIVAVGLANEQLGVSWSRPGADAIARDKARQRDHLAAHGLPSPRSVGIGDDGASDEVFTHVGLPCIVKPTRGAGSTHVERADDVAQARVALAGIRELARSRDGNFYDDTAPTWALVEEFLPGDEITVDGAVISGRFHLGGVHTKVLPDSPWFEEDLYTLPHGDTAVEREVTGVLDVLARSLDLDVALLNAEFRRAVDGTLRIVEFSTRISGGHVYRNIRDAHDVDLVALFLQAAGGDPEGAAQRAALRHPGRLATCIKFLYRDGIVEANHAGEARHDGAFREYYGLARRGEHVRSAPHGFDLCGVLSVWGPYDPDRHPVAIRHTAERVAALLGLDVTPVGA